MEENPNPRGPHLNSKWVPLLFDPQNSQNINFIQQPTHATRILTTFFLSLFWAIENFRTKLSSVAHIIVICCAKCFKLFCSKIFNNSKKRHQWHIVNNFISVTGSIIQNIVFLGNTLIVEGIHL